MADGEVSPLRAAAIQLHEMYVELKAAGFTRGEAMELVAKVTISGVAEGMKQANEDND
jgi:hypothetical protein